MSSSLAQPAHLVAPAADFNARSHPDDCVYALAQREGVELLYI